MYNIKIEGPLHVVYDTETGATIKECASAREAAIYAGTEKAGDVGNLAKHLVKKYGTDHLFTDCMGDDSTAEYDHDKRAAVCARAHHEATGKWPTEKEMKEAKTKEQSLGEFQDQIYRAFNATFPSSNKIQPAVSQSPWIVEIYPDHVIASLGDDFFQVGMIRDVDGSFTFDSQEKWVKVKKIHAWIEKAARLKAATESAKKEAGPSVLDQIIGFFTGKEGRRHSAPDQDAIQQIHELSVKAGADCMVLKQADGKSRWVLFSSNGYNDRDGEWVSLKAQEQDTERMTREGQFGPLRLWHIGYPDAKTKEAGLGLDIGDCDYSVMVDGFRIESGTFRDERIAAAIKDRSDQWATSVGFFHPLDEPDRAGVYHNIYTFERSLLPRNRQSNYLTPIAAIVKENDMTTKDEKLAGLSKLFDNDPEATKLVLQALDASQKEAEKRGLTLKQDKTDKAAPDPVTDEAKYKEMAAVLLPHLKASVMEDVKTLLAETDKAKAEKDDKAKADKTQVTLDAIVEALKELNGDLPRGLKAGFRASTSDQTIIGKDKLKEGQQPADPLGDFLTGIGVLKS